VLLEARLKEPTSLLAEPSAQHHVLEHHEFA
jgi:hypothetical protein